MKKILKINLNPNRIYGLDILRCLAVIFVVLTHGNIYLSNKASKIVNYFTLDGVGIFFVLSGFLIGSIFIKSFKDERPTTGELFYFWKRRWFRTLPNYFIVLFILIFLTRIINGDWNFFPDWEYFIFSQNLFKTHPYFFPEAWSLSVEEWFYLLIPLMIFGACHIFKISTKRTSLYLALVLILGITFLRYYKYLNVDVNSFRDWDLNFRKQVFTRLDSIMFGVIGAYISIFFPKNWIRFKIPFFILGILMLYHRKFIPGLEYDSIYSCVFFFSISALGTLFTIPFLSSIKQGKGFVYKAITYLSIISYSMYLLNYSLVREILVGHTESNESILHGTMKYFFFWALTIVLSILLYKFYERPMTDLRDKKLDFQKFSLKWLKNI